MKFVIVLAALIALAYAVPVGRPVPSRHDIYGDDIFKAVLIQRFQEIEDLLFNISEQKYTLQETKSKEVKEKILKDIADLEGTIKRMTPFVEKPLKETDLSTFEKVNYRAALNFGAIVQQELTALAAQVNDIHVSVITKD